MEIQYFRPDYRPITVKLPTPKLPSPNAYDAFARAGDALRETEWIRESYDEDEEIDYTVVGHLLRRNTRALTLFHTGLSQQYLHPPVRSFDDYGYHPQWGNLIRLLVYDIDNKLAHGAVMDAAQRSCDVIQFGVMIPHGMPLNSNTPFGLTAQRKGQREIRRCINYLDARQTRLILQRMQHMQAGQMTCAEMLQEDLYTNSAGAPPDFLRLMMEEHKPMIRWRARADYKRFIAIQMDHYIRAMRQCIATARKPYVQQRLQPKGEQDYFTSMLPDVRLVSARVLGNQVHNEELILALALRIYKLEHGRYPASLQDLTPVILPAIPKDPFATGQTYRYKLKRTSYLLYSLGPDTRDNHGSPLTTPHMDDNNYPLNTNSTGDIVFGKR